MKCYVGYKGGGRAWLFRSRTEPTPTTHPLSVQFCWGGYRTRREALKTAMYQDCLIENDPNAPTPLWTPEEHNQ